MRGPTKNVSPAHTRNAVMLYLPSVNFSSSLISCFTVIILEAA